MRHLNNGTDHRHSKSCCDQSSPARRTINTLRPTRNEQHFADNIFKRIFFNENVSISIKISLKFVPKGPINIIPALVQIMAWRLSGDKPLSEAMTVSFLMHICITRPQWVKWNHMHNSNGIWLLMNVTKSQTEHSFGAIPWFYPILLRPKQIYWPEEVYVLLHSSQTVLGHSVLTLKSLI